MLSIKSTFIREKMNMIPKFTRISLYKKRTAQQHITYWQVNDANELSEWGIV